MSFPLWLPTVWGSKSTSSCMDSPTLRIPSVGSMEKGLQNTRWHDQNILPTLGTRRGDMVPDLQTAHIQLPLRSAVRIAHWRERSRLNVKVTVTDQQGERPDRYSHSCSCLGSCPSDLFFFFFNLWGVPAGNEMDKSQHCPQDSEIVILNRLLFEKESCLPRARRWSVGSPEESRSQEWKPYPSSQKRA